MKNLLLLLLLPFQMAVAQHRIVVLGSSTAAGAGPKSPDSAWVNLFRKDVQSKDAGSEVFNLAVGGYNSYKIMSASFTPPEGRPAADTAHNIDKALSLAPDIIIINMPSNDIVAGFSQEEYLQNIARLVDTIRSRQITYFIATPQPRNTDTAKRNIIKALNEATRAAYPDVYINFWDGIAAEDGSILPLYNSGDGVHLNGRGHALLVKRVEEKLAL